MTGADVDRLHADMRPHLIAEAAAGRACALATIVAARGGPMPVGSQMVITGDTAWGFLSGGCIEADVARHGRAVIAGGEPRRLVYGEGSAFIDMRLPCGGRLEVLVERVPGHDPAVAALARGAGRRAPVRWLSDGLRRQCGDADDLVAPAGWDGADIVFLPPQRFAVIGCDPFALAMAEQARLMGWETTVICANGPEEPPLSGVTYTRRRAQDAIADMRPDRWTALAIATHDLEVDQPVLRAALASDAGYVGVLGSRRRLPERLAGLRAIGVAEEDVARLKAPIGLPLPAANPREVALAVVGEIIAGRETPRR